MEFPCLQSTSVSFYFSFSIAFNYFYNKTQLKLSIFRLMGKARQGWNRNTLNNFKHLYAQKPYFDWCDLIRLLYLSPSPFFFSSGLILMKFSHIAETLHILIYSLPAWQQNCYRETSPIIFNSCSFIVSNLCCGSSGLHFKGRK